VKQEKQAKVRVPENLDGNGQGREVELSIRREVGGLEDKLERREDEGGRP
jgi:hypothetical protein